MSMSSGICQCGKNGGYGTVLLTKKKYRTMVGTVYEYTKDYHMELLRYNWMSHKLISRGGGGVDIE